MKKVLVASLVAHAALFAVIARERPANRVVLPAPPLEEMSIEVETPPLAPTPAPEPVLSPEPAPAEPALATAARRVAEAPAVAAPASSAGIEPIAGANTDWVVNLGAGVTGSTPRPSMGSGANPFLTATPAPSGPAPEGPPKKSDPIGNSLKSAFLAPDQINGIIAPVTHAVESETRMSLAPVRGNAVFRAIVDSTGAVTALHIVDASSDRAGWEDARQKALAALQQKKLNLRGANGATIDIRVESELRYPSGATNRVDVTGPLSLSGDVSDFGARQQRVVRARLQSYTPL